MGKEEEVLVGIAGELSLIIFDAAHLKAVVLKPGDSRGHPARYMAFADTPRRGVRTEHGALCWNTCFEQSKQRSWTNGLNNYTRLVLV